MSYEQRRINWTALAAATALALGVTLGLPAAMDARTAPDGYLATLASADANVSAAPRVSLQHERIEVVAVREHATVGRWFSFASHKRAG